MKTLMYCCDCSYQLMLASVAEYGTELKTELISK
jgi:hypothetical protein